MPLGFIAKEQTLLFLAERNPKSVGAMASYSGVEVLDIRHQGKAMLQVLRTVENNPPEELPPKVIRIDEYPSYKQSFKEIKKLVVAVASDAGLASEFIASKKQIHQYLIH